jgi:hypothetical protein
MKLVLLMALFVVPSAVHAVPIDSNRCGPFVFPFKIQISINGTFYYSYFGNGWGGRDTSYNYESSIMIDIALPDSLNRYRWSTIGDTLQIVDVSWGAEPKTLNIIFDSIMHIIREISYDRHRVDGAPYNYDRTFLKLRNFSFDSVSIYTTDSSLASHLDSVNDEFRSEQHPGHNPMTNGSLVSLSSIDLAGTFQPIHLSDKSSVRAMSAIGGGLHLLGNRCVFPATLCASELEFYSILGEKEMHTFVPLGSTSTTLPHLPTGLYFVRFDGNIHKVYIAQ